MQIGIDVCLVERIRAATLKQGFRFLKRFLLPSEICMCVKNTLLDSNTLSSKKYKFKTSKSKINRSEKNELKIDKLEKASLLSALSSMPNTKLTESLNIQRLASFWAIKESISKALGVGIGEKLSFKDIKIKKDSKNKPFAKLINNKKKYFKIKKISISTTHENLLAIATCLIAFKK